MSEPPASQKQPPIFTNPSIGNDGEGGGSKGGGDSEAATTDDGGDGGAGCAQSHTPDDGQSERHCEYHSFFL